VSKRDGDDLRAVRRNGFTGPAKKGGRTGSALTPVTPVGPGTGECISIH